MAYDISQDFTDKNLVSEGVRVEFFGGSFLHIASTESPKYKAALSRLAQQNKVRLDTTNEDTVELVRKITCECMAKHILLGWEGIADASGEVPYSREKAFEYLMGSSKLRDFVTAEAERTSNFQAVTAEEVGKPSAGPSNGDLKAVS